MNGDKKAEPGRGEDIVFRYDRTRRLERASEGARWLAGRAGAKKPGILGVLLATRASRILFFTILGLAVYFLASPLFEGGAKRSGSLGAARYSGSALYYEGRVLVALVRQGGASAGERIESVMVAALAEGSAASFEFPIGAAAREEYRLALAVGPKKPERLRIRIAGAGGSLELLLPVD